jgi:hypothetical protein
LSCEHRLAGIEPALVGVERVEQGQRQAKPRLVVGARGTNQQVGEVEGDVRAFGPDPAVALGAQVVEEFRVGLGGRCRAQYELGERHEPREVGRPEAAVG